MAAAQTQESMTTWEDPTPGSKPKIPVVAASESTLRKVKQTNKQKMPRSWSIINQGLFVSSRDMLADLRATVFIFVWVLGQ